ncbi:MAG: Uma2 family endonuclease [Thermoanaerobaculia bacterium]
MTPFEDPERFVIEMIDGRELKTARGASIYSRASGGVLVQLRSAFDTDDGEWWIVFRPEVRLGGDVLVPDVCGWRRERLPSLPDAEWIDVPPNWVCDVTELGPVKRECYARHGVQWAWLVNPIEQFVEVFRIQDGHWLNIATHGGDETVSIPPFEAIVIPLSRLWLPAAPAA